MEFAKFLVKTLTFHRIYNAILSQFHIAVKGGRPTGDLLVTQVCNMMAKCRAVQESVSEFLLCLLRL